MHAPKYSWGKIVAVNQWLRDHYERWLHMHCLHFGKHTWLKIIRKYLTCAQQPAGSLFSAHTELKRMTGKAKRKLLNLSCKLKQSWVCEGSSMDRWGLESIVFMITKAIWLQWNLFYSFQLLKHQPIQQTSSSETLDIFVSRKTQAYVIIDKTN